MTVMRDINGVAVTVLGLTMSIPLQEIEDRERIGLRFGHRYGRDHQKLAAGFRVFLTMSPNQRNRGQKCSRSGIACSQHSKTDSAKCGLIHRYRQNFNELIEAWS
jgi:hypothetical protein